MKTSGDAYSGRWIFAVLRTSTSPRHHNQQLIIEPVPLRPYRNVMIKASFRRSLPATFLRTVTGILVYSMRTAQTRHHHQPRNSHPHHFLSASARPSIRMPRFQLSKIAKSPPPPNPVPPPHLPPPPWPGRLPCPPAGMLAFLWLCRWLRLKLSLLDVLEAPTVSTLCRRELFERHAITTQIAARVVSYEKMTPFLFSGLSGWKRLRHTPRQATLNGPA